MFTLTITLIIVIITCIISISGFNSAKIIEDLIFSPPAVTYQKQWYRFITSGLIHADVAHLAFNMIALYSFGRAVENGFVEGMPVGNGEVAKIFDPVIGRVMYVLMYVVALVVSLLPTYFKHKTNYSYRSLGASGAVSAVIFAGLLLEPRTGVGILFIPFAIKGYIFGPLYLVISTFLAKRGNSSINHSAHIWGAIFGMAFIIVMAAVFSNYPVLQFFVLKVRSDLGI